MTKSRTWALGTALVVVLVLVAGWLLVISPKRGTAADLNAQAAALVSQNQSTEQQIAQLKVEQQQLPAEQAQLAAIQQQIPNQPLLPSLLRQVSSMAYNSGVTLSSVSPAAAIAAVPGDQGVTFIPVSITVNGDFKHLKSFLLAVEKNKRAMLVFGYTIAPQQATGTGTSSQVPESSLTMALQSRVFMTSASGTAAGTTSSSAATPSGSGTDGTADSTTSGSVPTSAPSPSKAG